jgi:hypothetical protein
MVVGGARNENALLVLIEQHQLPWFGITIGT